VCSRKIIQNKQLNTAFSVYLSNKSFHANNNDDDNYNDNKQHMLARGREAQEAGVGRSVACGPAAGWLSSKIETRTTEGPKVSTAAV